MKLPEFKNKQLLKLVFIHRSFLNETTFPVESNERIEFLGDSILSFVVSSYIFEKYKDLSEGELTNLRSVLTNTETLSIVARKMELGKHLQLSRGEEGSGGRDNKTILANTFEALIGGIFIDQGLEATRSLILDSILSRSDEFVAEQGLKDSKSKLQEILQEKHKQSPSYKTIEETGPDHAKLYTIGVYLKDKLLAQGMGKSKQDAEKNAAKNALINL